MKMTLDQHVEALGFTLPAIDTWTDFDGRNVKVLSYDQMEYTVTYLTESGETETVAIFG